MRARYALSSFCPQGARVREGATGARATNGGSMLIVRNCFVAKPGNASKLAAQLKEAAGVAKIPRSRVLTDLTGEFNRVILEYEVENVGEFEERMKDYTSNELFREKMKGYTDLWVTGSREILRVV